MPFCTLSFRQIPSDYRFAAPAIFTYCHRLQVLGIAASAIPAEVVYDKTLRNFTPDRLVSPPMRPIVAPLDAHYPITVFVTGSTPLPATFWGH